MEELLKRCKGSKLECSYIEKENEVKVLEIIYHKGKKNYPISISSDNPSLNKIKETDFENYSLIDGYEAIWSAKYGVVECIINTVHFWGFSIHSFREYSEKINGKVWDLGNEGSVRLFEIPYKNNIKLYVQTASKELLILRSNNEVTEDTFKFDFKRIPVIRIEGLNISRHDEAIEILEKIGNSSLFNMDLINNFGYFLTIDREYRPIYMKESKPADSLQIIEPKNEYDKIPLSLYWYARSSRGFPLLQFLSYYQILEYYFPIYSRIEAQNKIKNLIKDPRFNVDNDADIYKILLATKTSNNSKSIGDERSQLLATLKGCVDNEELRNFILENVHLKDYFLSNNSKKLSSNKISITSPTSEIINEISERLYDIRCKIVHSKINEEELESLVPISPEIKFISNDIEILAHIAVKVIIINSKKLSV